MCGMDFSPRCVLFNLAHLSIPSSNWIYYNPAQLDAAANGYLYYLVNSVQLAHLSSGIWSASFRCGKHFCFTCHFF